MRVAPEERHKSVDRGGDTCGMEGRGKGPVIKDVFSKWIETHPAYGLIQRRIEEGCGCNGLLESGGVLIKERPFDIFSASVFLAGGWIVEGWANNFGEPHTT